MDHSWWLYFVVGVLAQAVDGALGMAFGVTATSVLLTFGTAPAQASAMVHIAEIFTTAASGLSHHVQRNIDWSIVRRIALPGVVGAVIGATLLSNIDGRSIAPFVNLYLAAMGVLILLRAFRRWLPPEPCTRRLPLIGFSGGVLDAIGGGGWGPIVTGTLIGNGHTPRFAIGSVNLTEFLVTLACSVTFVVTLGIADLTPVIPLILGGLVSAPFAGYLTRVVPARPLMVVVACLILVLSGHALLKFAGLI